MAAELPGTGILNILIADINIALILSTFLDASYGLNL